MARIRVGVIGAGWVTDHHLPARAAERERASVVAICDPDQARARTQAARHGIPATHADAAAMLDDVVLDAVDICAPREAHPALCRLAADRGLAILCQKSLAPDLAAARQLVAQIGARVPLMEHENWRFRAYYRRIRAWLDGGVAGQLRHVRLDFLSSGMIPDARVGRPAVRRQPMLRTLWRLLVMEILIHHLDALRFLVGELEMRFARLERSNEEMLGEDVATLVLERPEDGLPLDVCGNLAVHGAPPLPEDRLRLIGSEGTIFLEGARLRLDGPAPRLEHFDADASYSRSYAAAIAHFLDGLAHGGEFETAPVDNLRTPALVEAAYALGGFESGR